MKKVLFFSLIMIASFAFGQNVKLKDGKVLIDGNVCLNYEAKNLGSSNSFLSLEGKKLFYLDLQDGGGKLGYLKIGFSGTNYVLTLANENSRKEIIRKLIEEKVIEDCKINVDNIKEFVNRYDQHFEESIIR